MKRTNNTRKMTALNAAFIYTIGAFLVQGINFITLPIFTALMSPQDFGIYASYENWTTIVNVLVGLQAAATITNAYVDYSERGITKYVSSITMIGWFSFIAIGVITLLLNPILSKVFELGIRELQIGIVQCLFLFFLNLLMNEYRIINRPLHYLVFSCLNIGLTIMGGVLFVYANPLESYYGRILGTFIAACLTGSIAIFAIYRQGGFNINVKSIKYALALSFPLVFHAFAGIAMGRTDQMMLLKMTTAEEMGIYSYGNKIGHIIYVLYTAINQAFVPWYYKKKMNGQIEALKSVIKSYIILFSLLTLCVLLILPELIKFISPPAYYGAIYTAPLIVAGFYMNFLYTFPVNYEFYNKKTGYVAIGTFGSAVLNVILNLILISSFGGQGAAVATIISYILLLIVHLWIVNKVIKNYEIEIKFYLIRIVFLIVAITVYFLLLNMSIVRWSAAVILGIYTMVKMVKMVKKYTEVRGIKA